VCIHQQACASRIQEGGRAGVTWVDGGGGRETGQDGERDVGGRERWWQKGAAGREGKGEQPESVREGVDDTYSGDCA